MKLLSLVIRFMQWTISRSKLLIAFLLGMFPYICGKRRDSAVIAILAGPVPGFSALFIAQML